MKQIRIISYLCRSIKDSSRKCVRVSMRQLILIQFMFLVLIKKSVEVKNILQEGDGSEDINGNINGNRTRDMEEKIVLKHNSTLSHEEMNRIYKFISVKNIKKRSNDSNNVYDRILAEDYIFFLNEYVIQKSWKKEENASSCDDISGLDIKAEQLYSIRSPDSRNHKYKIYLMPYLNNQKIKPWEIEIRYEILVMCFIHDPSNESKPFIAKRVMCNESCVKNSTAIQIFNLEAPFPPVSILIQLYKKDNITLRDDLHKLIYKDLIVDASYKEIDSLLEKILSLNFNEHHSAISQCLETEENNIIEICVPIDKDVLPELKYALKIPKKKDADKMYEKEDKNLSNYDIYDYAQKSKASSSLGFGISSKHDPLLKFAHLNCLGYGLLNNGYICFFNSLMQVLYAITPVRSILEKRVYRSEDPLLVEKNSGIEIIGMFLKVMKFRRENYDKIDKIYNDKIEKWMIDQTNKVLSLYKFKLEQFQDVSELLQLILEEDEKNLHSDSPDRNEKTIDMLAENTRYRDIKENTISNISLLFNTKYHEREIFAYFNSQGNIIKETVSSPDRAQNQYNIMITEVAIDEKIDKNDLVDLLNKGNNIDLETFKIEKNHFIEKKIIRKPFIFAFNINRITLNSTKIENSLDLPVFLFLDENGVFRKSLRNVEGKKNEETYVLFAVVCHENNSVNFGHYNVFIRFPNIWVFFNDEKVIPCVMSNSTPKLFRMGEKFQFDEIMQRSSKLVFYIKELVYENCIDHFKLNEDIMQEFVSIRGNKLIDEIKNEEKDKEKNEIESEIESDDSIGESLYFSFSSSNS